MRIDTILTSHALEVLTDLGMRRVGPGPIRVRCEGITIEVSSDIALDPRVGVALPGPADARLTIENQEVILPAFE